MDSERSGPRRAGLAVIFVAAMLIPAGQAAGDTTDWRDQRDETAYKSALADALGDELAALSAFSETRNFARAAALARIEPETGRRRSGTSARRSLSSTR